MTKIKVYNVQKKKKKFKFHLYLSIIQHDNQSEITLAR